MALTPHSQPHYDSLYDDSFYNVDDAGSVSRHQSVQQLPSLSVQTTQQRPQSIQQRQTIQQSHPPIHSVESESGSFYNINVPIAELGSYHQRNNATQQPERSPVDFVGHGWTQNDFQPGQALPGRNENIMGSLTPEEIAEIDTLCGLPALLQLIEMGFPPEHARIALRQCDGNLDRATMFCLENDAQQMNFFLRAELEQRTQNVPEPVTVVRAGGQPVSQQVTPSPSVSPVAVAGGTPTAGSAPKEKKSLFRKLFKSSNTASKRSAGTTTTIVQQQTQQQAQPRVQQPQQQPHQQPHQHQQPQQLQQLTAAHPNPHFVGAQVVTSLLVPAPIPSARQGEQVPYEPLQTTIVPPPVNPNFVESNPPSPATSLAYLQNGGQEDWSDFDIPVVEIMNPPPKTKGAQKPSKKAPQTANTRSDQQSAVPAPVPVPVPAPVSSPSRNGQYEVHSNHPPGQFQQPRHYQGSPGKPTQVSPQYSPANNYPQQQLSTQTHQLSPTEAQPYSMRGYTSAPVPAPVPAPQATVPAHQPGHLHRHLPREESTMEDYGSLMDITTTLQELQQKRENFHGMNIPVVDATVSQLGLSAPKMEDYEYFSSESDGSPDGRRNQSYIKFADESSTSMSYYGSTVHMDPFYDEKKLPRVSKKEKALPAVPVRSPEELQPTVATESSSTANAVDPFMFIVSSTQSQTAVEQGEEDVCEDQNQVLEQRPSFGSMNSMGSVSDGNYVAQGPTALEMVMTFETDDATDDKEDKYDVRYRELEGVSVDEVEYVSTADLTATTTLTSELGNTVTATLSEPWSPTVTATASRPMMLVAEGLVEDDDIHIVADTTTVLHGVEDVMNYTAVAACEDMASSAVANDANADDHFNPNVSQFDWNNAESVSVDAARCDVGTDDGFAAFEGDTVVTVEPAVAVESVQEDEEEDDEIPPPPEEEYDEERDGIQDDTPAPLSSVVPVSRRRYVYAPSIDVMVVTAEEETVSSAEEPVDIPLHVEEVIVADVVQEAAEQAEQLAEPQAEVQGEVQGEVQAIEVSVIPSSVPVPNVQEIVGCEEPVVEPSPVESRVREIPPSFLAESSTSISDTVTAVPPAMTSERTDEQVGFDMPTPASVSSTASVRHRPSDPSFEAQQELDALNAPYHTSSVAASFPNAVGIAVTSDDQTSHAYSSSGAPSVVSEFDDDQVPVFSIQGQFVITDFAAPTTPFQRRNLQPYFCEQVGNKWRATIVLKQFKLKKNENSPQGSRPDQAALGDCVSEEVCRDLCESFAPPAWAEKGAAENSSCTLCKVAFTMFSKPHHCRNCGYLVCTQCSDKLWPSSMVPSTYHNNEKIVRVCHSCHFLTEQFIVALRKGDFNLVRTLYSSGNINLHQPYTAYVASAYAVSVNDCLLCISESTRFTLNLLCINLLIGPFGCSWWQCEHHEVVGRYQAMFFKATCDEIAIVDTNWLVHLGSCGPLWTRRACALSCASKGLRDHGDQRKYLIATCYACFAWGMFLYCLFDSFQINLEPSNYRRLVLCLNYPRL